MARRPTTKSERERLDAEAVALWAGEPKTKNGKRRSMWNEEAAREDVRAMIDSEDWGLARPQHFVELYARLHAEVYGTPPLELATKTQKLAAASLAARVMKQLFAGDPRAVVDFIRWVWRRQSQEEKKRRAGLKDGDFRVTWRYQFSAKLVTDYRRDQLTAKGARS